MSKKGKVMKNVRNLVVALVVMLVFVVNFNISLANDTNKDTNKNSVLDSNSTDNLEPHNRLRVNIDSNDLVLKSINAVYGMKKESRKKAYLDLAKKELNEFEQFYLIYEVGLVSEFPSKDLADVIIVLINNPSFIKGKLNVRDLMFHPDFFKEEDALRIMNEWKKQSMGEAESEKQQIIIELLNCIK